MENENTTSMKDFDAQKSINAIHLSNLECLKPVSMDKIFERITDSEGKVKKFQTELNEMISPHVESHWYRCGNASTTEVNESLDKIVNFIKSGFDVVSSTDTSQSENIKNLCVLISLLAIAETRLYAQFYELTSDSDSAIDIMIEYEKELQAIANNGDDTQENVRMVAETLGKILEEKNKEVINVKARFEKWRRDGVEMSNKLAKRIEDNVEEVERLSKQNDNIVELMKALETTLYNEISEKVGAVSKELEQKTKKSFFDSLFYKIAIGITSISALVISFVFL